MKKMNFAICDLEAGYAVRLTDYISQRQNIPFQILAFSGLESLMEFTKEHEIELLLISAKMMCAKVRGLNIRRIVILSEGEVIHEYQDYPTVYKYQSSDSLVAEVMETYVSESKEMAPLFMKREAQIYGVYSPVGRCGKTTFALTLGQILAQKQSVLYLNLEECSGFAGILRQDYKADITDLVYYIRQQKGSAIFKMNAVAQKLGKLDFIPPAYTAADLQDVRPEEWMTLLGSATSVGGYESVILDMGGNLEEQISLLGICTEIFTPVCEDIISRAKLEQYQKQVTEMEYEDVLRRTKYLRLPFTEIKGDGVSCVEQLVWSDMGDFIRNTVLG